MSRLPRVLVVDDEAEVLAAMRDLLRRDAQVFATADSSEARRLIEDTDLDLVMADQRMPVISGVELLTLAAARQPRCMRVLITGWSDIDAVVRAVNDGRIDAYIAKPWSPERIRSLIAEGAERSRLGDERRGLVSELAQALGQPVVEGARGASAQAVMQQENVALHAVAEGVGAALRGLREIEDVLPICMDCGRVKTGGARWEEVVAVLKRIPAFLSHGYCPECVARVRAGRVAGRSRGEEGE